MIKNFRSKGIKIAATALALAIALPVFAQTTAPTPQNLRQQFKHGVDDLRQNVKREKTDLRQDIKLKRTELNESLKAKREEANKRFEEARKEAKAKVETRRAELKERLGQMKDERKKNIALRADKELNRINERWTTHFLNVLNHLNDILGKVELRAEKAKANGKDVAATAAAILKAKQAIAAAKTAVEEQAKKSYVVVFKSEEKLKDAFKAQRDLLHKDLFGLRDGLMKDARKAAQDALQSLRGIPKVDEEPAATPAPSGTTQ